MCIIVVICLRHCGKVCVMFENGLLQFLTKQQLQVWLDLTTIIFSCLVTGCGVTAG